MNWLFLSDLQGVYHDEWQTFINMDNTEWDGVVVLGDIDTLYLKSISERFKGRPIIGVLGNHDYPGDLEYYNIVNIHREQSKLGTERVTGIEGCVRYKQGKSFPMYTQAEMIRICDDLPAADIIISHNSPFGIHDKTNRAHLGYLGLKNYIEKHQPTHVFHGHQHKHQISMVGKTKVVCVFGGWVWNQEKDTLKQVLKVAE
ncbi:metallophosphoesterase family protein [Psychrobacillus sp. FSL K6-1464]|uniref:metallophosphoesterase family protein n=1 Tax=Psychrobacillus sp. FSL K6-1464 TaxID=2921545 RepID=UPI0030F5B764